MSQPTVDELFRIITIDKSRKMRLEISLKDNNGDIIPIRETVEKLTEFVSDKLKDEKQNTCKQQIMPLMAQAMVGGLVKYMKEDMACIMLSQEYIRYSLLQMMTVSFYLLKWIQKNNILIHTNEYPITEEEIDSYDRINRATDLTISGALIGEDPEIILENLIKNGKITNDDLEKLGFTKKVNHGKN